MSTPWMKFYPRDWRGDQSLRAVSVAARGLWIECLCIMHEAKPYGHLVLNGDPVGDDTLARMAGVSVDEVSALMAELRQAGVLSVTRNGIVFSRRMTKDHARAQKGRKSATKRWSQVPDDVEQSGAPNGSPIREPITQKPENRSQKVASQPRADGLLDRLCDAAGVKGNPPQGLAFPSEIISLTKAGYDLESEILPAIRKRPNPRARSWAYFIPQIKEYAERVRCIEADQAPERKPQSADTAEVRHILDPSKWSEDRWQSVLDDCRARSDWPEIYGPPPWAEGCLVPRHLWREGDRKRFKVAA